MQIVTVLNNRVLERGEDRLWRCFTNWLLERGEDRMWRFLGIGCWREVSAECDGVWDECAGVRRGQIVAVFGIVGWREESTECCGVWEEVTGERRV